MPRVGADTTKIPAGMYWLRRPWRAGGLFRLPFVFHGHREPLHEERASRGNFEIRTFDLLVIFLGDKIPHLRRNRGNARWAQSSRNLESAARHRSPCSGLSLPLLLGSDRDQSSLVKYSWAGVTMTVAAAAALLVARGSVSARSVLGRRQNIAHRRSCPSCSYFTWKDAQS